MTRRIESHWNILGIATLLMIAVPWLLLSRQPETPPEKPELLITKVKPQEITSADMALEKPIFSPERKQLALADGMLADAQAASDVPDEAVAQQAPAPTLVGVVSKRRGKTVAIVKGQDGSAQTLSPGQNIDGWRLLRVGKSGAKFSSSSGTVDVALDFTNKAIGGPAVPAGEPNLTENPVE